jgi:peptidyl-prolyl cis-trans isomerase A (cyclophilin A)
MSPGAPIRVRHGTTRKEDTMRTTIPIVTALVLLGGVAAGCKGKGGDEAPPPDKIIPKEEIIGAGKEAPKPDLEKIFEAPKCAEPTSPDPLHGTFTLEQALEGLPGKGNPVATITTSMGKLTCELYADKAPSTVANFVGLARGLRDWWNPRTCQWVKKPFYDGLIFHRIIPQFMIQGGCPLKNGSGSPGYRFADEFSPDLKHDKVGTLSMANAGPDTNGSQFFIIDKWDEAEGPPTRLDGKHTVFGLCTPPDVVFKIARVPQTGKPYNRPLEDVVIESVSITRKDG